MQNANFKKLVQRYSEKIKRNPPANPIVEDEYYLLSIVNDTPDFNADEIEKILSTKYQRNFTDVAKYLERKYLSLTEQRKNNSEITEKLARVLYISIKEDIPVDPLIPKFFRRKTSSHYYLDFMAKNVLIKLSTWLNYSDRDDSLANIVKLMGVKYCFAFLDDFTSFYHPNEPAPEIESKELNAADSEVMKNIFEIISKYEKLGNPEYRNEHAIYKIIYENPEITDFELTDVFYKKAGFRTIKFKKEIHKLNDFLRLQKLYPDTRKPFIDYINSVSGEILTLISKPETFTSKKLKEISNRIFYKNERITDSFDTGAFKKLISRFILISFTQYFKNTSVDQLYEKTIEGLGNLFCERLLREILETLNNAAVEENTSEESVIANLRTSLELKEIQAQNLADEIEQLKKEYDDLLKTNFFDKLCNTKYGNFADHFDTMKRLLAEDILTDINKKNIYSLISSFVKYISESGLRKTSEAGIIKEISQIDAESISYFGGDFSEPSEIKKVVVISPGRIFENKIIINEKVKEII